MTSHEIRDTFLKFFSEKNHQIVQSAPMVVKNDPTLMFTNAGMNQFKDIFLGNSKITHNRVADSQKCLRVTGKHNDLEEVGHDSYHHTMFEMLGNWSFGDYFKKEAIDWAWEYLIDVARLDPDRIYATIFEGNSEDQTERDTESYEIWSKHLAADRILTGSKKDNFWEMGDSGPCGPCSEIHIDLRAEEERKSAPGQSLVNKGHPQVIEIWNLVFIQFNRKANGNLESLPMKHVDTGMGFERLCMAIQGKQSNYDTDLFQPIIHQISELTGIKYGDREETNIAMRVIADHLRAIAFSIADGQTPSNNKAGYVIRRILRRAVRYGFTYLDQHDPFIYRLVPVLIDVMGGYYTELSLQEELITRVIKEEESSFLNTLETGIRMLDQLVKHAIKNNEPLISGKSAFELYDTYGFPLDLTELILREHDLKVDREQFDGEMEKQRNRSKQAAEMDTEDWSWIVKEEGEEFVGYDTLSTDVNIRRYRQVKTKNKSLYHLVFDRTPFYAESGGQIGDRGMILNDSESVKIIDTKKENDLIIHISNEIPENPSAPFRAIVDEDNRLRITNNHTATHLLHQALRKVLGNHAEQKGSLVQADAFRFDFSHYQKVTDDEIEKIESLVNQMIRKNIPVEEIRSLPMTEAQKLGAIALFGEKYGDNVRVIRFDNSVELCGGTHVKATGQIGYFKIFRESAIAAGIRRIEAVTGDIAERFVNNQINILKRISAEFEKQQDLVQAVREKLNENTKLQKQVESFRKNALNFLAKDLGSKIILMDDIRLIIEKVEVENTGELKELAFQLKNQIKNLFLLLGAEINGKAHLALMISENIVEEKNLNASEIIRVISSVIQGGGGGQPFFATAGGKNPDGIEKALNLGRNKFDELIH